MSLRFAKILSSGSPAEVTSITASTLPEITGDGKQALLFADSNGRFYSSSKIYYTSSAGGQLTTEEVNLAVYTITASGIPDDLTDRSSILFINEGGGFETTSSLRYVSTGNKIVFDGVFSGSFTGDGSGLTGVIANTANPLANGPGIASASSNPDKSFEFTGAQRVNISIMTASNGGLEFSGSSADGVKGIQLASSLTGSGLEWATPNSVLQIKLSGSGTPSNGTSGLKLTADGLAISDNINGDGLDLTSGVLSIDLASPSGLQLISNQLRLNPLLAGDGLQWSSSYNILEIDPTQVVTSSREITFRTGSNNLTLTVTSDGIVDTNSQGFTARLIDQPEVTYDVSDNLTGDFIITGDFSTQATTTTFSGSSLTVVAETFIADPFPMVNSGSSHTQGGIAVKSTPTKGAFLIFDSSSNVWAVSNKDIAISTLSHTITGDDYAIVSTTRLVNDTEANIISSTPVFGTDTATRVGQVIVQQSPLTGESPLFIYA